MSFSRHTLKIFYNIPIRVRPFSILPDVNRIYKYVSVRKSEVYITVSRYSASITIVDNRYDIVNLDVGGTVQFVTAASMSREN